MTPGRDGPTVAVVGGDTRAGRELAAGLADIGASVEALDLGTLTRRESLRGALEGAARRRGPLDGVVIATVGTEPTGRAAIAEIDSDEWRARVEVPLHRTLVCFQGAFDCLADNGGTVVVLVPTLSLVGAAGSVPWAAVTEGQRALAKAAARGWGRHAITVNCVAVPAALLIDATADDDLNGEPLDRPGQPAPALGRPEMRAGVAAVVHTLLSPAWQAVTGATVAVDGGVWMAP